MKFTIMSPTSLQTVDVNWVEVETEQGNFVIKPGHEPMIVMLAQNKELSMELTDGSNTILTIAGGILEITRDKVTLLLTHE